eukprot:CAMPEP_0181125068 /NCGR_PEP_ID=MMETSP1071-20121207/26839_1 /TAXON_ID=35127 /ORGANISM="Thalassiosira sp., Strain NH16" /LENGTH=61 /DNA_ID=CAMNT_0023210459 /DNA_START=43 /DNA_END=225 /DNA_ORIENTATION=-
MMMDINNPSLAAQPVTPQELDDWLRSTEVQDDDKSIAPPERQQQRRRPSEEGEMPSPPPCP